MKDLFSRADFDAPVVKPTARRSAPQMSNLAPSSNGRVMKRHEKPVKKEGPSPQEIRDKVELNRAKNKTSVVKSLKANTEIESDNLLKSDVATNKPDDPMTQEKLKGILQNGGFSFNPKEREALGKILA